SGVLQAGCTPEWVFCGLRTPDRILFIIQSFGLLLQFFREAYLGPNIFSGDFVRAVVGTCVQRDAREKGDCCLWVVAISVGILITSCTWRFLGFMPGLYPTIACHWLSLPVYHLAIHSKVSPGMTLWAISSGVVECGRIVLHPESSSAASDMVSPNL